MFVLGSFELVLDAPSHFAIESALRIEVVENSMSIDIRHHGWNKAIPGYFRPSLDRSYD